MTKLYTDEVSVYTTPMGVTITFKAPGYPKALPKDTVACLGMSADLAKSLLRVLAKQLEVKSL